jgi:hypothetical protein
MTRPKIFEALSGLMPVIHLASTDCAWHVEQDPAWPDIEGNLIAMVRLKVMPRMSVKWFICHQGHGLRCAALIQRRKPYP